MATTIEKLFLQIFERKLSITEQVKHQVDLFDHRLASKCVLGGTTPPPWLFSPSLSSLPNELNKEELISGLLLPQPQPANPYSCSGYSVQPATTANNSDLPNGLCTELHLVDKSFDAGDRLSVLSHFPVIDDVQCNLDGVPELDVSVTSPQDCRGARMPDSIPDHSQSLARIQRSKSRQKALELRNSVKTGKTCPCAENNVGSCTSRSRGSGVTSLQFDHVDQSDLVKLVEASNKSCVVEEVKIGECMVKENSGDVYHGRSPRSRSSRQKASSAKESGNVCNSTYIAKEDDLTGSISKQQPNQVNLTELVSVVGHASSEAQKENEGNHRGNEMTSSMYSGGVPRCTSSSPKPNSTEQPLDVDSSSYIDNKDSRDRESIDGSSLQPNCVTEISELAKHSSVISNESYGAVKAKVSDKWSKEKGSGGCSGRITRSRSCSQQADCESLKLDGSCGNAEEESKRLSNPVDDFRELVKPFNITDDNCGVNEMMSNCQNNEGTNCSYYGKITGSKSSNQQVVVDGLPKADTSSNKVKDNDNSPMQSVGRSSEPHQPSNLVREVVDLQEVLATQANALPCIESENMVDLGICDAVVAGTDMDSDGPVEACSVTSRSSSDGSSLGMEVSVSRPATDCAMPVKPKQLDFDEVEDCSLNDIANPTTENKQQSLSSERRISTFLHSTGILDKVSVNNQEKPILSIKMPFLEDQEVLVKEEKPRNDSSEAFVNETALLVDENTTNSVHKKINSAISENQNGDCYIMSSWPQHKRRKIAGQLISSCYASSSLMRQHIVTDSVKGNVNAIEDPDAVQISERFYMSHVGDDMQPNAIKSSFEGIHENSGPHMPGPEFPSPKLQVEEVEPGLEGRSRSANTCGGCSPSSLTKRSTGVSQGSSLEKVASSPTIVIFDETGQHTAEKNQFSLQLEDRFELGSTEFFTCTETTMQQRKSHLGRNGKSPSSLVSSPHSQSMDLIGADQSMPVYEWFGVENEGTDFGQLVLSDNALASAIAVERLCKSVCLETPLCHFSSAFNKHKTLNLNHSVPNGVLEGMEMSTTVNMNSNTGKQLEASSNCFTDEVNDTLHGRLHSDSPALSNAPSTWDIRKPYSSPIGKLWEGVTSKSGSSEKRASSIPDLPCISEENENTIEVLETFQDGVGLEQIISSVKREPLADSTITKSTPILACESETVSDRYSLASVNTECSFTGTCRRDKLKHGNQKGNRRKHNIKAKENESILGVNGVKRANKSHYNRSSKPILSGKTNLRKGGPGLMLTESRHNNIVSNITSFIPLVQQKQAAAVVTGKKDVKVKALEAAEVAKRLAERKENERKMRKEALKLERAKMGEQNLRQLELEKEKREQERKRKEADMAAKKRQREEEEKRRGKGKESVLRKQGGNSSLCTRKIYMLREERERKNDERAFENKESKDKSGKHDKIEKEKGDNNLQKVPETEPGTSRVSTIDDGKSSIIPEGCVALGDCDDNSKEMTVFSKAAGNGNIMSNISQEQSYEISPYKGSDDEDEDDDNDDMENNKYIPSWARKNHVGLIVSSQQSTDPQTIFTPESFPEKSEENQDSVSMSPRNIHFCIFLFILFNFNDSPFVLARARNLSFEFPYFNLRNLTLLGDSYLRKGVIGLTRDATVPSSSSGTVIYNHPIPFFDQESNSTASFSTRFSFSIPSVNENSFGDGFSFFLSQDNQTLGSPGGYLGLVNSSQLTKNKFVAVEFDTRLDAHFNDPNDHHVGLDIDSLNSIKTADPILQDIDLKSGDLITAWIDYKNDLRVLKVYMSYSSLKPRKSLLTVDVDLSEYLKGDMYVGFSGSTEGSTELHLVANWSFRTSGFLPLNPNSNPHNVSDSSVTVTTPVIPISNAANKLHRSLGFGLGIAGPAFFCAFLVAFGYISVRKWRKIKRVKSLKAELVTGPKEFSYKELKLATRGFNSSRIVGRGAFGNVYKAFFKSSGTIAAVKRSKHSHEGKTEFLAELSIIACLRHKNLIQLLGWCVEKGEVLLVYEFMPYGSLDRMLYEEGSELGILLNWAHRQKIAVGLASSLTYLHHECEQQVIHRDIKTSNIMLDGNFNARLGDFGLARLMEHDKSPVSTLTAGTMGYLAPEYLHCGKATEKTDVFSYGVVILELACGKRPIEREPVSQKMVNLVDWVWGLYGEGKIIEAADSRLNGEFEEVEMRKLLLVGLSCANPDAMGRPTMRRVLQILNGEAEPIAVPRKKPSLTFSCGLALTLEDIVSDSD
ncbi:unnamed protein product [Dovyalis caffra]|uniref:non-specific serine/threonine protein kinase n=1 Tax=Dovyalis caffra TaxID=77055 RepID=A0AAV1QSC0_9ROSI|nr:unnamed protein product [Dovyalis caffra]